MQTVLCAPFYKGLVNAPDQESIALITRQDPTTHEQIPLERYVELVRDANSRHPELVQDIARATASAVQAHVFRQDGLAPMLMSVEGCEQVVGGRHMTGGRIMESIWHDALPSELTRDIPVHVEEKSHCTVQEIRELLKADPLVKRMAAVTHSYHKPRVERLLQEEMPAGKGYSVDTPESVMETHVRRIGSGLGLFAIDLVQAGMPSADLMKKERIKETFVYGPIHYVSRWIESLSGRNLEMYLADRTRKK
jgi:hypothetical protein